MKDFIRTGGFNSPPSSANVAALGTATLISTRVPDGTSLLITEFYHYVSDIGAWLVAKWKIKINGVELPAWASIQNFMGDASNPYKLDEPILVRGGDLLEVTAYNADPAITYGIGVGLKGFYGRKR